MSFVAVSIKGSDLLFHGNVYQNVVYVIYPSIVQVDLSLKMELESLKDVHGFPPFLHVA